MEDLATVLETKGIEFKRRYTQKKRQLSRITTTYEIDSAFTAHSISNVILLAQQVLSDNVLRFEIEYCGGFDVTYVLTEDDPVLPTKWYKVGKTIGRSVGTVARWIGRSSKTEP